MHAATCSAVIGTRFGAPEQVPVSLGSRSGSSRHELPLKIPAPPRGSVKTWPIGPSRSHVSVAEMLGTGASHTTPSRPFASK